MADWVDVNERIGVSQIEKAKLLCSRWGEEVGIGVRIVLDDVLINVVVAHLISSQVVSCRLDRRKGRYICIRAVSKLGQTAT